MLLLHSRLIWQNSELLDYIRYYLLFRYVYALSNPPRDQLLSCCHGQDPSLNRERSGAVVIIAAELEIACKRH